MTNNNNNNKRDSASILIIGAGIAGLSAAKHLLESGLFTQVTIMEANAHPGGRVQSTHFGSDNIVIEIGAQWFHGLANNPLLNEIEKEKLISKEILTKMKLDKTIVAYDMINSFHYFHFNGMQVKNQEEYRNAMHKFGLVMKSFFYEETNPQALAETNDSEGEELTKVFQNQLNSIKNLNEKQIYKKAAELFLKHWHFVEGTLDLNSVSLKAVEWFDLEGGEMQSPMPEGMSSMVKAWTKFIGESRILLSHQVTQLNYSNNNDDDDDDNDKVHVTFKNSQGLSFTQTFDHVIVTSSASFLQQNHFTLFQPNLSEEKLSALAQISLGQVEKIFIELNLPIIPANRNVFGFLQEETSHQAKDDWLVNGMGLFYSIHPSGRYFTAPVIDDATKQLARTNDEEIRQKLEKIFIKAIGNEKLRIVNFRKSNWTSDPFVLGSYTHVHPRANRNLFMDLNRSILSKTSQKPLILFAGEHTHPKWFSTMQGAYDSGKIAATEIINIHKKKFMSAKL